MPFHYRCVSPAVMDGPRLRLQTQSLLHGAKQTLPWDAGAWPASVRRAGQRGAGACLGLGHHGCLATGRVGGVDCPFLPHHGPRPCQLCWQGIFRAFAPGPDIPKPKAKED